MCKVFWTPAITNLAYSAKIGEGGASVLAETAWLEIEAADPVSRLAKNPPRQAAAAGGCRVAPPL
jgi:hypothetical protein